MLPEFRAIPGYVDVIMASTVMVGPLPWKAVVGAVGVVAFAALRMRLPRSMAAEMTYTVFMDIWLLYIFEMGGERATLRVVLVVLFDTLLWQIMDLVNPCEVPATRFKPKNVYQDLARPFYRVCLVFVAQGVLTMMLLYSVQDENDKFSQDPIAHREMQNYGFWGVGVVCVQLGVMTVERTAHLGDYFAGIRFWVMVCEAYAIDIGPEEQQGVGAEMQAQALEGLQVSGANTFATIAGPIKERRKLVRYEPVILMFRAFMSFLANAWLHDVLFFIGPLFLLRVTLTPLDCVEMAFAWVFLSSIDDIQVSTVEEYRCMIHQEYHELGERA